MNDSEIVFIERYGNHQEEPYMRVLTAVVNHAAVAEAQFEPWATANGSNPFSFPDYVMGGSPPRWALCGNSVRLAMRLAAAAGVHARRVTLLKAAGDYHEVVSLNGILVDPSYGRVYGELAAIAANGYSSVRMVQISPQWVADPLNTYLRSAETLETYFRGICLWESNGTRSYLLNHGLSSPGAVASELGCKIFGQQ